MSESISTRQYYLACLAEECDEVSQRIQKAFRFGLHEVQDGQSLDNLQRIQEELDDLQGIIDHLTNKGILHAPTLQAIRTKQTKVDKYLDYARKIGAVKDEA